MRGTPLPRARKRLAVALACLGAALWSVSIAATPAGSRVCVGAMDQSACVPPT